MGVRLDHQDSYLTEFYATLAETRTDGRGTWLRLDRSAFYPTSGGQPHDTGALTVADVRLRVRDVQVEDGAVWHLVAASAGSDGAEPSAIAAVIGSEVHGLIDWERRYRHMQRHTGQHLLSQALVRVNPEYGTRSVSMRGAECTIDFGGEADEAALAAVEAEVNSAARRALAVMTFQVDDSRLGEYRLRRPAKVSGTVRLVAIGDYDLVACGGSHVRNSAEVLPVKIVGLERVKGGTNRLTFRAGEEALDDYACKHAITSTLSVALSAPVEELPARVEQLRAELAEQGLALDKARRAQAAALAERLSAQAEAGQVVAYLGANDAALFPELVDLMQRATGLVTFLAAEEGGAGRVRFAFLAGPGVDVDVRPLLNTALAQLGGRGGGRPDRAQGAAEADEEQALAALSAAAAQLNS